MAVEPKRTVGGAVDDDAAVMPADGDLSGAARRQMNRKFRREQRQQEQQARKRRSLVSRGAVALVAVAAIAGASYFALPPILASYNKPATPSQITSQPVEGTRQQGFPGQQYPDQGRTHIKRGETHVAYNSIPPTSGPHWDDWPQYGVYDRGLPDEWQIHHLEHGGIMVQYQCASGCQDLVDQLTSIVRRYRYKVILAPYDAQPMPNRIALSAWTRLDSFDDFDESRIVEFIEFYRNKGPEAFPDSDADVKR